MDIEKLSKSQIVLLTLMVSFVTSIATGIVTVSLMDQAPPSIAQTVNRVVERTVERVVPSGQSASAAVTTEKTVVVKESDLIVKAVEAAVPSVVRLFTTSKDAGGKDTEVFLGLGVVVSKDGTVVTDVAVLPASGSVVIAIQGGSKVLGTFISSDAASGLALLQGATSTAEGEVVWKSASFSASESVLGETVISISGRTATRLADGIVTVLPPEDAGKDEKVFGPRIVEASIPAGSIAYGSPFINNNGEIVGISTTASRAVAEGAYLASSSIVLYTTQTKAPPADKPAP